MKRLYSSPDLSSTSRVRNWERKDSHLKNRSIKPEKTTNLDLILDFLSAKIFLKFKKQVPKRRESLAKDINLFFLRRKSPKDSNPRTRLTTGRKSPRQWQASGEGKEKSDIAAGWGRIALRCHKTAPKYGHTNTRKNGTGKKKHDHILFILSNLLLLIALLVLCCQNVIFCSCHLPVRPEKEGRGRPCLFMSGENLLNLSETIIAASHEETETCTA
jgi:hypothetical protein